MPDEPVHERPGRRVVKAFAAENAAELLFLTACLVGPPLPPSLA